MSKTKAFTVSRSLGLVVTVVLCTFQGSEGAGAAPQGGARGSDDAAVRALNGAIDIHVHSYPDNVERSIDALEVSMLARAHGMRGLVLKNHYDPTSGLAYMVRKQVAGLEVFGGVDLNLTVGGMNSAAVEHMTQVSGRYGRF